MKITRSALKSLIKEEMNRINEDSQTPAAYLPMDENPSNEEPKPLWVGQLGDGAPTAQFELPASEVGMARLGANFSVRWPADGWDDPTKAVKLTNVTVTYPADADESGGMYSGSRRTVKLFGRGRGTGQAALMALQGHSMWQVYGRDIEAAGDAWYDISQGTAVRVGTNGEAGGGFVNVDQATYVAPGDEDDE